MYVYCISRSRPQDPVGGFRIRICQSFRRQIHVDTYIISILPCIKYCLLKCINRSCTSSVEVLIFLVKISKNAISLDLQFMPDEWWFVLRLRSTVHMFHLWFQVPIWYTPWVMPGHAIKSIELFAAHYCSKMAFPKNGMFSYSRLSWSFRKIVLLHIYGRPFFLECFKLVGLFKFHFIVNLLGH